MIYQWVYSYSCWNRQKRPGDARTRGFGTYSWTEGLDLEDIDELERRCSGYNYPTDYNIPARPTDDEINKFLPVAFYSFTLASGKRAIVRTRYVGEGFYDKRWGAIISHGLILEEGEDWPRYPMEYFDSLVFWNELPKHIRDEAVIYKDRPDSPQPPYLPALEFDDLRIQNKYTPAGVIARMESSAGFSKNLYALLGSYMTAKTDIGPLCISATIEEVPWLFAGLTMAFPPEISSEISFSTYLSDKMPAASEAGRWYRIAAVEKHNCSLDFESPVEDTDYKWYVDTLFGSRKGFMEFLQNFSGMRLVDIPVAARLYCLMKKNVVVGANERDSLLNLLKEHGNGDVRKDFIGLLSAGKGIPDKISGEWLLSVFALVSDYEELRPLCYELFLRQRSRYQDDELDFFMKMADRYPQEITQLWLDEYASTDISTTGLMYTFASLNKAGRASELENDSWDFLFGESTIAKVDWGRIISKAPSAYADCAVSVLCRCPNKTVSGAAMDQMVGNSSTVIAFARDAIAGGWPDIAKRLVVKHLSAVRANSFESLRQIIFGLGEDFGKKHFEELFKVCSENGEDAIGGDLLGWLISQRGNISPFYAEEFFKIIDGRIVLPAGKDASYRKLLDRILSDENAKELCKERSGFFAWVARAYENGLSSPTMDGTLSELMEFALIYGRLTVEEQVSLCNSFFPMIISSCDDKDVDHATDQHSRVLTFFGASRENSVREQLAHRYIELSGGSVEKQRVPTSDIRFVAAINCALGGIRDETLRRLIVSEFARQVFKKFGSDDLIRAGRDLGIHSEGKKRHWEELCEAVKNENTLISKIKSAIGLVFRRR